MQEVDPDVITGYNIINFDLLEAQLSQQSFGLVYSSQAQFCRFIFHRFPRCPRPYLVDRAEAKGINAEFCKLGRLRNEKC